MTDATIGSVGVEVVPNADNFWKKFKAATQGDAKVSGAELGEPLGDAIGDVAGPEARDKILAALKDLRGDVNLDTTKASADVEKLQLQVDKLNHSASGISAPSAGKDLGGIGAGAESAGFSISDVLLPAIAAAATAVGPLAAVGAAAFGTVLLGAKGLEDQVKTGLTPAFEGLEGAASDALGPGISAALGQLQHALPQLTPLVTVFGNAIGQEADKLATYLNNGGLQDFTTYAERELPIVEKAFESLTVAGVAFFNAITPLGNALLDTVTKIANVMSDIFGKVGDFSSGANGNYSSSKTPGKGQSNSDLAYIGNVLHDTFTLGGLTDKNPPKINFSGIHSAFVNHPTVAPSLNSQQLNNATSGPGVVIPLNSQALHFATNNLPAPSLDSKSLNQATAGLGDAAPYQQTAAALGTTITAYNSAATAAATYKDSEAASTLEMQLENNAAGLLSQALQGLGGDTLGVAQSNTAFHAAISAVNDSLKTNGATLDINTEKGQANLQAINAAVSAAQAHEQAVAQQTGSTQQATKAYNDDITALENQLGATGAAKTAIDNYVTSIDAIPPLKETQLDINASVAVTAANLGQSVHDAINNIPGHSAGGSVADGWFKTGEAGVEYGYKSGSHVEIFNQAQMAAALPEASAAPQVILLQVDGRTLATVVNEQNQQNGRR